MAGQKEDISLLALYWYIGDAVEKTNVKDNSLLQNEIAKASGTAFDLYSELESYKDAHKVLQRDNLNFFARNFKSLYEQKLNDLCTLAISLDAAHDEYPRLKAFAYTLAAFALVLMVTAGILAAIPTAAGVSMLTAALSWSGLTALVGGSVTTAAGVGSGIALLFSIAVGGAAAACTPSQSVKDKTMYDAIDKFVNQLCSETQITKTVKPAHCCFWRKPTVEIQGPDLSVNLGM